MPSRPQIVAAREEVTRSRAQLSRTISEIEGRVGPPVRSAKEKLDVVQLVKNHPFAALAAAAGVGALVASSGADTRVASAAAAKTRQAAAAGSRAAREAPSRSSSALRTTLDSLAVKLATTLIDALREPRGVTAVVPEVHHGLGFVDHAAPAHADDGPRSTTA